MDDPYTTTVVVECQKCGTAIEVTALQQSSGEQELRGISGHRITSSINLIHKPFHCPKCGVDGIYWGSTQSWVEWSR